MPDISSSVPLPKQPKKEAKVEPLCSNCKWGEKINGRPVVHCAVDLPPFVNASNDARRYLAHENYVCALWKGKA